MARQREFTVADAYPYNRSGAGPWIISHVWRYKWFALTGMVCFTICWLVYAGAQVLIGQAAASLLGADGGSRLLALSLIILALLVTDGVSALIGSFSMENVATRFEADARQELYASLLGKSQTFHNRQRVGDIMARATDDTSQLGSMIAPGSIMNFEAVIGIIVPLGFIISIKPELVLAPLAFVVCYIITVRRYLARLDPVVTQQREQFGKLNAGLEESISGIEVVKASAQELFERRKFRHNARLFRDVFVAQGYVEARYLPLLIYGAAVGLTFLHAMLLYRQGRAAIAEIIGVMGLMNVLRFPVFISIYASSLWRLGLAGAERILKIINDEAGSDEQRGGFSAPLRGGITFEHVSFGHEREGQAPDHNDASLQPSTFILQPSSALLTDISFEVRPGQTVAIVGQTGSGKSTLTQLINRTYDATAGRVLIDGVDVQEWNLDSLRSQIGKIEQDVFLFSRSIAENIAFGLPAAAQEQIEAAARAAQAHDFIMAMPDGYQTVIGERGVTLSGGQRQRIALARAFLSDPRVLILDDSTSAIDSATEDEIQKAIRKAQEGRTTLLITHRLSQIRWADLILVLDQGRLVACGSHEQLLRTSPHYRRVFARYDVALPPLETEEEAESVQLRAA